MKSVQHGDTYILRLQKGERLVASLLAFAVSEQLPGAWVSGLGGASSVELGFYQLEDTREYEWKLIHAPLEITSLQGNIAWSEDKPFVHLHGSFSDEAMRGYGGHVRELTVAGTCELWVTAWRGRRLTRSHDDEVGLKLLDL